MTKYEPTFASLSQHEVPEWFQDAKFGIFSHWTVGSVPAFAPLGKDPFTLAREEGEEMAFSHTPYAEWYQNSINIPGSPAALAHLDRLQGTAGQDHPLARPPPAAPFGKPGTLRAQLWQLPVGLRLMSCCAPACAPWLPEAVPLPPNPVFIPC